MRSIAIQTHKSKQVIDITDIVNKHLPENFTGLCNIFILHTTAAVTCADLDPGTDLDMLDAFYEMVPKLNYSHPHNPAHVPDHILAALIGPSITIPAINGELNLGEWQRVVLMEFDGPRSRNLVLSL